MSGIFLELPWPPTANTYWRRSGNRYFISDKGILFRNQTWYLTRDYRNWFGITARLNVQIIAYPPDKRKRDLDNLFKCVLDSLQYAQVFTDDNQIDSLSIIRMPDYDDKLTVYISRMN